MPIYYTISHLTIIHPFLHFQLLHTLKLHMTHFTKFIRLLFTSEALCTEETNKKHDWLKSNHIDNHIEYK